jgi:UDP-N-acetylglucosamine transferase subunit ALG13
MFSQLGKLKKMVKVDHNIAKKLANQFEADFIISDNRYGFRTEATTNIIITHQLKVPIPALKNLVNKRIKKLLNDFDCCWIPDSDRNSLCGMMTDVELDIPIVYLGLLSRFKRIQAELKYDYLIIISGPEPERSAFANQMIEKVRRFGVNCCFVAPFEMKGVDSICNPSTKELNQLIAQSKMVLSRAGYTSLMEMISIGKEAILIPTKGQYEQEYLAQIVKHPCVQFVSLEEVMLIK